MHILEYGNYMKLVPPRQSTFNPDNPSRKFYNITLFYQCTKVTMCRFQLILVSVII